MTGEEFDEIRKRLGLSRKQIAGIMGYKTQSGVSIFTVRNGPVSRLAERLMLAYDAGYRPLDWPRESELFQPEIRGGKRASSPHQTS